MLDIGMSNVKTSIILAQQVDQNVRDFQLLSNSYCAKLFCMSYFHVH